eukprot:TRINITY_DN7118_c0_g1_i1.p1 TRINITY_DN7118_c0_g1~~TRINITY_DN7118_c0_g1_i1.p1  ORF type:complete len:698 (+),score=281.10 TRINITY_DN7118_c0_g1_i1:52-2145(+)
MLAPSDPPVARKGDHTYTKHGVTVADEYAWLRNEEWPKKVADKPEIIEHLTKENEYYARYLEDGGRKQMQDIFFEELKGRVALDDQSTYRLRGDYHYYVRTEADKEYKLSCRKYKTTDAPEEIYLDENKLAEGKKFFQLSSKAVSPDHKLLAYSSDLTGGEVYTIRVKNLETGELSEIDEISGTLSAVVWHEDGHGFFYTPVDDSWRRFEVKFHTLGTPISEDKLVYKEDDPDFRVSVGKSASKEYIFVTASHHGSTEYYAIDMKDETMTPRLIHKRKDTIRPDIDHSQGTFFQKTNEDCNGDYKILKAPSAGFDIETTKWELYRPEHATKYLISAELTTDYMLLEYNDNGLPELVVHSLKTQEEKSVVFPEKTYTASLFAANATTNDIRVTYSSLCRPNTEYSYDFATGELTVLKVREIPSGLNSDEYVVDRIFAETEGVRVPISLLYRKDLDVTSGAKAYLTGYGSYGITNTAHFRSSAISIANMGLVYAIGHIRGGEDLGLQWYEAAKFLNKKRTFNDFIACAEKLIEQKLAQKGEIVISGGSAGGMLMGACMNARPELYKAVVAHVPFVDIVTVMLDKELPLTPGEFKEWGNPEDEEYFKYMMSYSPYDNIKAQDYPHIFITAGLSDPRVGFWEAAKFASRLRAKKTDSNILLLKTNMDFGHGGASGRFEYLKEMAEELVFVTSAFGLQKSNL